MMKTKPDSHSFIEKCTIVLAYSPQETIRFCLFVLVLMQTPPRDSEDIIRREKLGFEDILMIGEISVFRTV